MKRIVLITAAILGTFALSSCNTMSGLGRDMQKAGNSLERNATR